MPVSYRSIYANQLRVIFMLLKGTLYFDNNAVHYGTSSIWLPAHRLKAAGNWKSFRHLTERQLFTQNHMMTNQHTLLMSCDRGYVKYVMVLM